MEGLGLAKQSSREMPGDKRGNGDEDLRLSNTSLLTWGLDYRSA